MLVLQLKSLGIQNVLRFDWMTAPSSTMLERALEFLFCLGALDEDGKLTKPLGTRMAEMPIDCMMAKIVSRLGRHPRGVIGRLTVSIAT